MVPADHGRTSDAGPFKSSTEYILGAVAPLKGGLTRLVIKKIQHGIFFLFHSDYHRKLINLEPAGGGGINKGSVTRAVRPAVGAIKARYTTALDISFLIDAMYYIYINGNPSVFEASHV